MIASSTLEANGAMLGSEGVHVRTIVTQREAKAEWGIIFSEICTDGKRGAKRPARRNRAKQSGGEQSPAAV